MNLVSFQRCWSWFDQDGYSLASQSSKLTNDLQRATLWSTCGHSEILFLSGEELQKAVFLRIDLQLAISSPEDQFMELFPSVCWSSKMSGVRFD